MPMALYEFKDNDLSYVAGQPKTGFKSTPEAQIWAKSNMSMETLKNGDIISPTLVTVRTPLTAFKIKTVVTIDTISSGSPLFAEPVTRSSNDNNDEEKEEQESIDESEETSNTSEIDDSDDNDEPTVDVTTTEQNETIDTETGEVIEHTTSTTQEEQNSSVVENPVENNNPFAEDNIDSQSPTNSNVNDEDIW